MTLGEKQRKFTLMTATLIAWIYENGYEATWGAAYRDPAWGVGHPDSLHGKRLAIDLNLFRDGVYLTRTEDHEPLGSFWKSIGGTWGGDFVSNPDGNHYSLEWKGMK